MREFDFFFSWMGMSYSYDHEEMKECKYQFGVKSQLKIYQFIEWIGLESS